MEEEFVAAQERLRPQEDKAEEDRSKEASVLPPRNRVSHHGGCYIRCFSFFLLLLSIASPRRLI